MKYRSTKTKLDIEANERDGNKCVACGNKSGIETHHKIPNLEKLENLITLCHACHKKEHNMAGCFVPGFDERRKIPSKERLAEISKGTRFKKGIYFNRHSGEWVGK